jgi:predicted AAA+ superfamily ATPase
LSLANGAVHLQGGKVLVLDEVHKYPTWAREIKNLHDRYHDLKIVFMDSSVIDISRQEADLSRRALVYELRGMSYREYLASEYGLALPKFDLTVILSNTSALKGALPGDFRPLAYFKEYLKFGYYPFYKMDKPGYFQRLRQLARTIVEYDMAEIKGFDVRHAKKILRLLYIIAQQAPFKPNIQHLADKTGIHRNSVNNYLYFLEEARLVQLLGTSHISAVALKKPEKIYLDNTNLFFALSEVDPSVGSLRETFFQNQVSNDHTVNHSPHTDFIVDQSYSFEIGGKGKGRRQIQGLQQAWVVKDDLEFPAGEAIPLWIFGFLY